MSTDAAETMISARFQSLEVRGKNEFLWTFFRCMWFWDFVSCFFWSCCAEFSLTNFFLSPIAFAPVTSLFFKVFPIWFPRVHLRLYWFNGYLVFPTQWFSTHEAYHSPGLLKIYFTNYISYDRINLISKVS